jgi:hypothetical protein
MTSQSPRIYIYKITFEEVPYYYYGVKKEKHFNQKYWGSPVTNKWCWELYTPKKQILQFFEFSGEGWLEANKVEKRIISTVLNDKWCLNENAGGFFSIKSCSNAGKKSGEITKTLGVGVHGRSPEQMSEDGKKGARTHKENGTGVFGFTTEQRSKGGKKGGALSANKRKELKLGIFRFTPEEKSNFGKMGAETSKELNVGIYALTLEQRSENGKIGGKVAGNQRWMCTETGFISNAGGLAKYQKAKNIDTSKRVRIS